MGPFHLLLFLVQFTWIAAAQHGDPFLITVNSSNWIIGNDLWNLTIGDSFGTKLMYKGYDLVGAASGHYVSYNGRRNNLTWTSAKIIKRSDEYTDISFIATEGEMHWVLTPTLFGAYQYFVNHAMPLMGEFRTLWRLDNSSFTKGYTRERDESLPPLDLIQQGKNVQDETWQLENHEYITKYDLATFLPSIEGEISIWGVYGKLAGSGAGIGSWYIHGGKDYFNGDHLKQELMVHRESETGDAVQLNMIHGTHYQAASHNWFSDGKTWGPWLWYMNDGSVSDAVHRAQEENKAWPYAWMHDEYGFNLRGNISGRIVLSDSRPASGAAVFIGDNYPNKTSLEQGARYYYRAFADEDGKFQVKNVREGSYALQAWSVGGKLSDVTTSLLKNDVVTTAGKETKLGTVAWKVQGRKIIWQVGDSDRLAAGFGFAGPPHKMARADSCPENLTYVIGVRKSKDWCFAQTKTGTWTIRFDMSSAPENQEPLPAAVLSVALAGYSGGTISIKANGAAIGSLSKNAVDPTLYRSGTLAGEYQYFEYPIKAGLFRRGWNEISFGIGHGSQWRGVMYDTLLLEWA